MDKKIVLIGILALVVVAGVAVYFVADSGEEPLDTQVYKEGLMVQGNANNDWYVNDKDVDLIQWIIDNEKTLEEYPQADADNNGVIDAKDIELVNKIINREPCKIWHINFHDADGNGTMDHIMTETSFPMNSILMTASTNVAIAAYALGIIDEVKGATYSSSLDKDLFKDTYLDQNKVVKVGTKSSSISFEDGVQNAASDLIKKENVTGVLTDWNRTYITNQDDFENANVDVIRVASGSTEDYVIIHSHMLLGLLFDKVDRAAQYTKSLIDLVHYVDKAVENADKPLVIIASHTAMPSSQNSDYSKCVLRAGSAFALTNVDFGGSASIYLKDHPEVYEAEVDNIVHLRASMNYAQNMDTVKADWAKYTAGFEKVKDSDKNQIMVSGAIPMSLRIAYSAVALHPDLVDKDKIDEIHQDIVDNFYNGKTYDIKSMSFIVKSGDFAA